MICQTEWDTHKTICYNGTNRFNHLLASARIYRLSFHANKPKTLVFNHWKRAFWACFREYWVYKFGQSPNLLNVLLYTCCIIVLETTTPSPQRFAKQSAIKNLLHSFKCITFHDHGSCFCLFPTGEMVIIASITCKQLYSWILSHWPTICLDFQSKRFD